MLPRRVGVVPGRWKQATSGANLAKRGWTDMGLKPKDLMMMPARVAMALQADGWWLRSEIVWHKPNPMPESSGPPDELSARKAVPAEPSGAKYFYDGACIACRLRDMITGPTICRVPTRSRQVSCGKRCRVVVDNVMRKDWRPAEAANRTGRPMNRYRQELEGQEATQAYRSEDGRTRGQPVSQGHECAETSAPDGCKAARGATDHDPRRAWPMWKYADDAGAGARCRLPTRNPHGGKGDGRPSAEQKAGSRGRIKRSAKARYSRWFT